MVVWFISVSSNNIRQASGANPTPEVAKVRSSPPPDAPTRTLTVQPPLKPTPKPVPATEPMSPNWETRRAKLHAQFLREFNSPKVGSPVVLKLSVGNSVAGILKELKQDGIQIRNGSATLEFSKSQLSSDSCLKYFAEDYACLKSSIQIEQEKGAFEKQQREDLAQQLADQTRLDEEKRMKTETLNAKERVAKAKLVLINSTWSSAHGYVTVEGQVGNISGRKIQNVEALAQFYTEEKTFITSDSALVEYNPLMPGQISPFKIITTHNPLMKTSSISFKLIFGETLDYVTKDEYDKAKR